METVESVAKWADETFGPATVETMYHRVVEEIDELDDTWRDFGPEDPAYLVHECADVCITLFRLVYHLDPQAIEKKMAINRAREWHVKGDGTGQHI